MFRQRCMLWLAYTSAPLLIAQRSAHWSPDRGRSHDDDCPVQLSKPPANCNGIVIGLMWGYSRIKVNKLFSVIGYSIPHPTYMLAIEVQRETQIYRPMSFFFNTCINFVCTCMWISQKKNSPTHNKYRSLCRHHVCVGVYMYSVPLIKKTYIWIAWIGQCPVTIWTVIVLRVHWAQMLSYSDRQWFLNLYLHKLWHVISHGYSQKVLIINFPCKLV